MHFLFVKGFESSLMPKTSSSITVCLKKMSKKELFKLAKKKRAKIPQYWTKARIIETLSTIIKRSDISKVNSEKSKNHSRSKTVYKIKRRVRLEDRVIKIFQRKGFDCIKKYQLNNLTIDVVAYKKGGLLKSDEHIVAQCTEKSTVVAADFKKLLRNVILYIKKNNLNTDCVKGYLFATGSFDKEVKSQALRLPSIQIIKLRLN